MIAEAIDTALTIGYALAGWVIFGATVAAILALAAIACGAWGVRALWRRCAPVSRPQEPPGESSAATPPPGPAQSRTARRTPSWAHNQPLDYEEAA